MAFLIVDGYGQILISNPAKPENKKSGRTVELTEALRIRDDGKNIVFRNPQDLSVLNDRSLIFFDYPFIYRYNKSGELIFKALKQGNGPGECEYPNHYYIQGDRMYVYSWIPPKVMEYDMNGRYIRERKVPYPGPFIFLGIIGSRIFGIRDEIRFSGFIHKEGFFETPYTLYEISPDFANLKKIHDFPMAHYIRKASWWRRGASVFAMHQDFLFIVHTSEYQIVKFDLRAGRVERIIKRKFARKKSGGEIGQDIYNPVPKQLLPPPLDYVFDILWVQAFRNSLWVFTSATNGDGGETLIDVFNMEGKYLDCFYLKFPPAKERHMVYNALITDDGFIFVTDENKDTGLMSIGKYAIKDSSDNL